MHSFLPLPPIFIEKIKESGLITPEKRKSNYRNLEESETIQMIHYIFDFFQNFHRCLLLKKEITISHHHKILKEKDLQKYKEKSEMISSPEEPKNILYLTCFH